MIKLYVIIIVIIIYFKTRFIKSEADPGKFTLINQNVVEKYFDFSVPIKKFVSAPLLAFCLTEKLKFLSV